MDLSGQKAFLLDDWEVIPLLDEIRRGGQVVKLEPRAMRMLVCLAEHSGEPVNVEKLVQTVWKGLIVSDDSVYQAIGLLRRVLGDDPKKPRYIVNVPRRGYRIAASVTPFTGVGPAPLTTGASEKTSADLPSVAPEARARRTEVGISRRTLKVLVILALGLVTLGVLRVWLSENSPARPTTRELQTAATDTAASFAPPAQSIAVLPLANESNDSNQEYFSDGLSEDLITALAQLKGVKVIGRTSAFQFRNSKENSRSIGMKLGVAHLLVGSVRRSGEIVRINAELINTSDGTTQWSQRYDRPYKDLFALQDDITHAVTESLRGKLQTVEHSEAQTDRPPSGNLEAYNALLQGRFYHARRTESDFRKAKGFYERALQLDPRYAIAWAQLSRAWTDLGISYLEPEPSRAALARARTAADEALRLSPDLAVAHIALADVLLATFEWRDAETEYRRAAELAPNEAEAVLGVGLLRAIFGDLDSAIALANQAIVTDPLQAYGYAWLSDYLVAARRLDEADRAIHRALELQPDASFRYFRLATVEILRGRPEAALAAAQLEPIGVWRDDAVALARQIGNDRKEADAALSQLIKDHANQVAFEIAEAYALRNDEENTFVWLDRAWTNREADILFLRFDPFLQRFANEPRFEAFCKKVGLPLMADR